MDVLHIFLFQNNQDNMKMKINLMCTAAVKIYNGIYLYAEFRSALKKLWKMIFFFSDTKAHDGNINQCVICAVFGETERNYEVTTTS